MKNRASPVLLLSFTALAHAVWAAPETGELVIYRMQVILKLREMNFPQISVSSEGTYRNSVGECVNQCPCGYYGSTYSRTCSEGIQ